MTHKEAAEEAERQFREQRLNRRLTKMHRASGDGGEDAAASKALRKIERLMEEVDEVLLSLAKQGRRMARPSYGEPEGKRPGTRPSVSEPDDPTSPVGFPQTTPIDVGPSRRSVPDRESARGRPAPPTPDYYARRLILEATARSISHLRPVDDVIAVLEVYAAQELAKGATTYTEAASRALARFKKEILDGTR